MAQEVNTYTMEREIDAAVQWWTNVLRSQPDHSTGDPAGEMLANRVASLCPPLSEEQLTTFAQALKKHLTPFVLGTRIYIDDPLRGAALRCVGVTYGPDGVLADAATEAEIGRKSLRFPFNTMMWIDPGRVRVRNYSGLDQIIWQGDVGQEK